MEPCVPIKVELFYEKNGLVLHTGLKVSQGDNFFIADFDPTVSETAAIPDADKSVVTSNRALGNPTFMLLCVVETDETLEHIRDLLTSLNTGCYDLASNNCRVHICKSIRYMRDVLHWPVDIAMAEHFFRTVSGRIFLYGAVASLGLAAVVAPPLAPVTFLGAAAASFAVHHAVTDQYFKTLQGLGCTADVRTDGQLQSVTVGAVTYTYYR